MAPFHFSMVPMKAVRKSPQHLGSPELAALPLVQHHPVALTWYVSPACHAAVPGVGAPLRLHAAAATAPAGELWQRAWGRCRNRLQTLHDDLTNLQCCAFSVRSSDTT